MGIHVPYQTVHVASTEGEVTVVPQHQHTWKAGPACQVCRGCCKGAAQGTARHPPPIAMPWILQHAGSLSIQSQQTYMILALR